MCESFLLTAQRCCLNETFLDNRVSFKHTLYDDVADNFLQPLPWTFKPDSLEPFINFLWLQFLAEPSRSGIRRGTFVEMIGNPGSSKKMGQPVAIIALDATYCEGGSMDENLNLAALLLLDDGDVALTLAWAHEIQENECFFGIVLVGHGIAELMDHATSMFKAPLAGRKSGCNGSASTCRCRTLSRQGSWRHIQVSPVGF